MYSIVYIHTYNKEMCYFINNNNNNMWVGLVIRMYIHTLLVFIPHFIYVIYSGDLQYYIGTT